MKLMKSMKGSPPTIPFMLLHELHVNLLFGCWTSAVAPRYGVVTSS